MQDPRMMSQQRKQKSRKTISTHDHQVSYIRSLQEASPPTLPVKTIQKASRKIVKNDTTPLYYRPQQRPRPSMEQESTAANEYRALRRKYLELEEESCSLGNELRVAEREITTLEDEKLQLLDELLVLEGLVDPSEAHP